MGRREELRPYKNKRLGFEGVFIHTIPPSSRNGYTYGLIFASVFAPNENIEIDHVVIKVSPQEYNIAELKLNKRYKFTSEVKMYYKTAYILGIAAKRECFMLCKINMFRIKEKPVSEISQPTQYVMTRIINVLKAPQPKHTKEELVSMVLDMPNEGEVERFINTYTQSYQRKSLNNDQLLEALYN